MTDTQRKRDPRYTRTIGEKPNQGRRYVENGKVRIEWSVDGKRRSRTIGDNGAGARNEADEELERLLGLTDAGSEGCCCDADLDEDCPDCDVTWLVDEFRSRAEALLDFADDLADSFEKGLVSVLDVFRKSDDDEDVDDSEDDPDEAETAEGDEKSEEAE